jgi:hypothetical protein
LWKYIEIQYGAQTIPNIIYMTKVSKNVESGFLYVLGTSYKNLIREWRLYYDMRYSDLDGLAESPEKIFSGMKYKPEKTITHARISPDGRFLPIPPTRWVGIRSGYMTSKRSAVTAFSEEATSWMRRRTIPILCWHGIRQDIPLPSFWNRKAASGFIILSLKTGSIAVCPFSGWKRSLISVMLLMAELLFISGVQQGQSDLFIYNIAARTLDQITKDVYDDLQPRFMDNGRQIIFASNRPDDTLRFESIRTCGKQRVTGISSCTI